MGRREQIENIVIGTLLNSDSHHDYFTEVRSVVSPDMFSDSRRASIFRMVAAMNAKGEMRTWPDAVVARFPETGAELAAYMVELASEWHFLAKKVRLNEWAWLSGQNTRTNVSFSDYVKRFVQLAYGE